jgi:hypothetical protein
MAWTEAARKASAAKRKAMIKSLLPHPKANLSAATMAGLRSSLAKDIRFLKRTFKTSTLGALTTIERTRYNDTQRRLLKKAAVDRLTNSKK